MTNITKALTLSCVVGYGSSRCNAKCPFCIAKKHSMPSSRIMSPCFNTELIQEQLKRVEYETAVLTGYGEPTLYPEQISKWLLCLTGASSVVLQTNGSKLMSLDFPRYNFGLIDTISVSSVSSFESANEVLLGVNSGVFKTLVRKIKDNGSRARASVVATQKGAWKVELERYLSQRWDEITLRPVYDWNMYGTQQEIGEAIREVLKEMNAIKLTDNPVHDLEFYELDGVSVMLGSCNNESHEVFRNEDTYRSLVLMQDGRMYKDWFSEDDNVEITDA